MPDARFATLIAAARRDHRIARALLSGIVLEITGDPTVAAWLGLFVAQRVKAAA